MQICNQRQSNINKYKVYIHMHKFPIIYSSSEKWNIIPNVYTMETHVVYKIWQPVTYTKYDNSCPIQNIVTRAKMPHHG